MRCLPGEEDKAGQGWAAPRTRRALSAPAAHETQAQVGKSCLCPVTPSGPLLTTGMTLSIKWGARTDPTFSGTPVWPRGTTWPSPHVASRVPAPGGPHLVVSETVQPDLNFTQDKAACHIYPGTPWVLQSTQLPPPATPSPQMSLHDPREY